MMQPRLLDAVAACWKSSLLRLCMLANLLLLMLCCCRRLNTPAAPVSVYLQSLKDAIVVTAGGAETLPFLAFFCVLPASLAFFVLYGKLVREGGSVVLCRAVGWASIEHVCELYTWLVLPILFASVLPCPAHSQMLCSNVYCAALCVCPTIVNCHH